MIQTLTELLKNLIKHFLYRVLLFPIDPFSFKCNKVTRQAEGLHIEVSVHTVLQYVVPFLYVSFRILAREQLD